MSRAHSRAHGYRTCRANPSPGIEPQPRGDQPAACRGADRHPGRRAATGTCPDGGRTDPADVVLPRSEEHTSELQSLMRISYADFCLKKQTKLEGIKQINEKT